MAALAFAFHFDRPVVDELGLIDELLRLPVGDRSLQDLIERQTYMPLATGRLKKPGHFNWPRLRRSLACGDVIMFGVGADTASDDQHQVELYLDSIALANRERANFRLDLPYRYQGHLSLGSAVLGGAVEVDAMVAAVVTRFAGHIDLVAGVVVAGPSHLDAVRVAICSGGLPGTAISARCTRLFIAERTWGPYAREPEWGTFLQRRHADAIGGPAAIRAAVEPFAVLEAGDVVFVQLTPYADALSPAAEAKRVALEALMQPILGAPSSRDPGGSRLDRG